MIKDLLDRVEPRVTKMIPLYGQQCHQDAGLKHPEILGNLATAAGASCLVFVWFTTRSAWRNWKLWRHHHWVQGCSWTPTEWKEVVDQYTRRWNFEHTVGNRRQGHRHKLPPKGDSYYHSCKGFHFILPLALVYADYMFLYVDEGAPVCSDSAVIEATALKAVLEDESIGLNLITNASFFFFFLAETIFPLKLRMMTLCSHCQMAN